MMAITAKEKIRGSVSGSGILGGTAEQKIFYTDAYNIALANGFVGSIEDWLESLKGKDGYTPVKGVDYTDGKDGSNGKDGYTPERGKDYWTEADQAAMVAEVIAALPKYNGEVVAV